MVVTSLQHGPVASEQVEVRCGLCLQCQTKVNCNNQGDYTPGRLQVILHYSDQGKGEDASDPRYGKNATCRL